MSHYKKLAKCFFVFALSVCGISCSGQVEDSPGKDTTGAQQAIRKCYVAYYAALTARDGVAARSQLSGETLEYYENHRKLAIESNAAKIRQLRLVDRLSIAVLQAVFDKEELQKMTREEVVEFGVLLTDAEEIKNHALGKITVSGDKATGVYLFRGRPTPDLHYTFYSEGGEWKLHLVSWFDKVDGALKQSLAQQGVDEESFLKTAADAAAAKFN